MTKLKGTDIVLRLGGSKIAAATNASITLSQKADEFTPIPGTADDDGWQHFRPGELSWSISHDGLFAHESRGLVSDILDDMKSLQYVVDAIIKRSYILEGTVHLSEVSVSSQNNSLAKITAKFECDDFPNLIGQ